MSTKHLPVANVVVNPAAFAAAVAASKKIKRRGSNQGGEAERDESKRGSEEEKNAAPPPAEEETAAGEQLAQVGVKYALLTSRDAKHHLEGDKKAKVAESSPQRNKTLRRYRHLNQPQ